MVYSHSSHVSHYIESLASCARLSCRAYISFSDTTNFGTQAKGSLH